MSKPSVQVVSWASGWGAGRPARGNTRRIKGTELVRIQGLRPSPSLEIGQREDQVELAVPGEDSNMPSLCGSGSRPTRALVAPPRGGSGTRTGFARDLLGLRENHMEVPIYSILKSKSLTCLSKSPQRTFLSFSGRKNELLYEFFQHASGPLNVSICSNVTTLSVNGGKCPT